MSTDDEATRQRQSVRLRAAWMYHVEGLTQSEIALRLGIGRVTVVRLLAEARVRNEVRVSIVGPIGECFRLGNELEKKFNIHEVTVVPSSGADCDYSSVIGAALGDYVTNLVRPSMSIGVGWGRTLHKSLSTIVERAIPDFRVISLLGGITKAREVNPSEFAWQFANLFRAESYLLTSPAFVDSYETKRTLIDRCGLNEVFHEATKLDACLVSVASMESTSTSFQYNLLSDNDRKSLISSGAVGDVLCNFFNEQGQIIDHSINKRVMSIPIETILNIPVRVLASGGADKVLALRGAIRLLNPTVLITDESTARRLLAI